MPRRMSRISPELVARLFDQHAAKSSELFAARRCTAPADIVQEAYMKRARSGAGARGLARRVA